VEILQQLENRQQERQRDVCLVLAAQLDYQRLAIVVELRRRQNTVNSSFTSLNTVSTRLEPQQRYDKNAGTGWDLHPGDHANFVSDPVTLQTGDKIKGRRKKKKKKKTKKTNEVSKQRQTKRGKSRNSMNSHTAIGRTSVQADTPFGHSADMDEIPVLAPLEKPRQTTHISRDDPRMLPREDPLEEASVQQIIDHRWREAENGEMQAQFRVRWVGTGPEEDEWLDRYELEEAEDPVPELLFKYESQFVSLQAGNVSALNAQVGAENKAQDVLLPLRTVKDNMDQNLPAYAEGAAKENMQTQNDHQNNTNMLFDDPVFQNRYVELRKEIEERIKQM